MYQHQARNIGNFVAQGLGLVNDGAVVSTNTTTATITTTAMTKAVNASTSGGYNTSTISKSFTGSVSSTVSTLTSTTRNLATATSSLSVSANGTIDNYALSCYSARWTWRNSFEAWFSTAVANKTFSTTVVNASVLIPNSKFLTICPSNVSTYKLCDGSPRADVVPVTVTTSYDSTSRFSEHITLNSPTFAPPPCTMAPIDCEYLFYNTSIDDEDLTLLGACGFPAHLGLPCLIGGGPVKLAYFPVTTTNGDFCLGDGSTITSMVGPSTVEALGTTFTSGSVCLSFQTLYATQEDFNIRIGRNFTDFILPLPSSAIFTQCGGCFSARALVLQ